MAEQIGGKPAIPMRYFRLDLSVNLYPYGHSRIGLDRVVETDSVCHISYSNRFPDQPVDRSPPCVPHLLQLPGDPLGPGAVSAVATDEEVFHRDLLVQETITPFAAFRFL